MKAKARVAAVGDEAVGLGRLLDFLAHEPYEIQDLLIEGGSTLAWSAVEASTAPPHAITDCTRATERALPYPLAAGICARRQATPLPSLTRIAVAASGAAARPPGALAA